MNDEEKKYLKTTEKMRPGFGVFTEMVRILKNEQRKINELFTAIDNSLLMTYETT